MEAFVVYVTSFSSSLMLASATRKKQIALFITKKINILIKYVDFSDIFSE